MKKALILILTLGMLLTSCGQSIQSQPQEIETTADPEVLEKFWEDYIDDCPFTISSSMNSWESPDEIEPLAVCNYLFLKMQRNSDTEDTNFDAVLDGKEQELWIKADKINEYQKRYFQKELDFRNLQSAGCYYDEEKDAVVLTVFYIRTQLPEVKYNEFDSYPHFELESLSLDKKENRAYAKIAVHDYRIPVPGDNSKITNTISFTIEKDGTYKLISSSIDFPPMEGSYVKGSSKVLPANENLNSFTTTGPVKDILPLFAYDPSGLKVASFNIRTGEYKDVDVIPLSSEHSEGSIILRNGHLLFIETVFNIKDDGIDTNDPNVFLSEIFLDGSESKSIPLPQNCSYISDISFDLRKLLYKETMDGDFIIYDFNDKASSPIPKTAPQIPKDGNSEELLSMEAFGHGSFTSDGTMVVLYKFGYEWGAGYAVYDIATKAMTEHPVRTAFGGYPIMTPNGLYIGGISDEGGSFYRHGFLKFNEGEIEKLPATPFPENFQYTYVPNGESRYIAMLMPVNDEEYYNVPPTGLTEMAVAVFDSDSLTIKDTGARIKRAPHTQCLIFMLDDSSVYLFDTNVSKDEAYIIENPFLK